MLLEANNKVISDSRDLAPQIAALQQTGAYFHSRGWSLGTSSNYSIVLSRDPLRILITASGKDKSRLQTNDFLIVNENGAPIEPNSPKPSAETMLHVIAAQQPDVGAILHTHSVWATLLSDIYGRAGEMKIEGYEMLKGLAGIDTHETAKYVDIFENTQDIPALAQRVKKRFAQKEKPLKHGFLLRRHGLYTWGRDLDEARRHVEIFEFLFEVIGRTLSLKT